MIIKSFFMALLFSISFIPTLTKAAYFFVPNDDLERLVDEDVILKVYLNTENERVNVLSGKIALPSSLELVSIQVGDSAVSLWIEPPRLIEGSDIISFAGMTPGGFVSDHAPVLSLKVRSDSPQIAVLNFSEIEILRHDGVGKSATDNTETPNIKFTSTALPEISLPIDYEAPEDFLPIIVAEASLNDGQKTLVWSTTDKSGSKVRSFVKEGLWSRYKEVTSPYILRQQSQSRTIYLKVIDEAGNKRVVTIPNENLFSINWSTIILCLILCVSGIIFLYRRRQNKY